MLKVSYKDRMSNEEVLNRVSEERKLLSELKNRKMQYMTKKMKMEMEMMIHYSVFNNQLFIFLISTQTNVMCKKRGHFNVELVVSMRPIRRDLIQRVFEISQPLTNAHGAPVHIGDPAILGINDLSLDECYGCKTNLVPGEVPVFWACGVTGLKAKLHR
ncbi:hypothetical protein BSL78_14119 [Apostichopus japonicus]|uniref:Uncharacterized protein n=1 Tax=Stichopus japonicus TaxID=307972 RepID=A0A2G8KLY0_STIJA|nr:hypothetical protein BSL78_14119 [Apostichopus japonicus]